jgi:predicted RNA binding protein YcfA (HicA-like mRNA interferase family)
METRLTLTPGQNGTKKLLIHDDGWFLVATRGSHRQFKHSTKPGRVTVAGKPNDDLAPGTLNSILKQSGLKK